MHWYDFLIYMYNIVLFFSVLRSHWKDYNHNLWIVTHVPVSSHLCTYSRTVVFPTAALWAARCFVLFAINLFKNASVCVCVCVHMYVHARVCVCVCVCVCFNALFELISSEAFTIFHCVDSQWVKKVLIKVLYFNLRPRLFLDKIRGGHGILSVTMSVFWTHGGSSFPKWGRMLSVGALC